MNWPDSIENVWTNYSAVGLGANSGSIMGAAANNFIENSWRGIWAEKFSFIGVINVNTLNGNTVIENATNTGILVQGMSFVQLFKSCEVDNSVGSNVYCNQNSEFSIWSGVGGGVNRLKCTNAGAWGVLIANNSFGDRASDRAYYAGNASGSYSPSAASDASYST